MDSYFSDIQITDRWIVDIIAFLMGMGVQVSALHFTHLLYPWNTRTAISCTNFNIKGLIVVNIMSNYHACSRDLLVSLSYPRQIYIQLNLTNITKIKKRNQIQIYITVKRNKYNKNNKIPIIFKREYSVKWHNGENQGFIFPRTSNCPMIR